MSKKKNATVNIYKLFERLQIILCSKEDISDNIEASKINDKVKMKMGKALIDAFKNTELIK